MLSDKEKAQLQGLGTFRKLRFQNKCINIANKYHKKLSKDGLELAIENRDRPISDYSPQDQEVILNIREELRECILNM
jgi:hypothetical protein